MTNKGKQQVLRQQIQASFPYLIKIDWQNGTVSRFINADEDMDFDEYDVENDTTSTETYEAYTFSLVLPDGNSKGSGTLNLSRLNNNTNMIQILRELQMGKRPTIEITGVICYVDGQVEGTEVFYDAKYYLTNPSWGDNTDIVFSIKTDEGLDVQMPCDSMNEITCAGVL